ncbi:MAG: hypothetical protein RSE57_06630 [Clostridia bacterium]
MKLKTMIFLLLGCTVLLLGCESNNISSEDIYSLSEIKASAEKSGYIIENSDYIDGGYEIGDESISILIPTDDSGSVFCFISSYKNEDIAQNVIKQIENEKLHDYTIYGNILAIYPNNYDNLNSIFENILSCNPDPCDTVFAKLKE